MPLKLRQNTVDLNHIQLRFDELRDANGLQVTLGNGATADDLNTAETRIRRKFPDPVRAFYAQHNGLSVDDPPFEIRPLDNLYVDNQSRIHFATADKANRIGFECSCLNEAGQWDIINLETGDRITFTMASFWTNKIWKWIDRRLAFWDDEV